MVNGTPGAYAEVPTERVRLRLLNASVARTYQFVLDDSSAFDQIASDGGLLPEPHRTDRVLLSPGERAEVVVEMEPGETRVLRSETPDLGLSSVFDRFSGGADRFDVLQLRAAEHLVPAPEVPDELVPDITEHAGDPEQVATSRTFELQGRSINGAAMDTNRVDEIVTAGDTEVWEVVNTDAEAHNFQRPRRAVPGALGRRRRPEPHLAGLKDTVHLPPDVPVLLLMTFRHADPEVPYMYHCHLLTHEDQGMMGQFLVVVDDEDPAPELTVLGDNDADLTPDQGPHHH